MFFTKYRNVLALALFVVLARSLIFVLFEGSYFESDQAIMGLMAKHISELKAFPIYFYGQSYLFAITAWFTAPFIWLFGATVFAIKLPLLLLNFFLTAALLKLFTKDCSLKPHQALISVLFFCLPPLIVSARFTEVQGGNLEPFIFVLLLWFFRDRGLLAGIIAGLGVMNRPFVYYGIAALFLLEMKQNYRFVILQKKRLALFAIGFIGSMQLIQFFGRHVRDVISGYALTGGLHFNRADIAWLFERNLANLLGYREEVLAPFALRSQLTAGHPNLTLIIILGALFALVFSILYFLKSPGKQYGPPLPLSTELPIYLMLVGVFSVFAYVFYSPLVRDHMLIRYNLLFFLFLIGLSSWIFQKANQISFSKKFEHTWTAIILLWCIPQAFDHLRFAHEYLYNTPSFPYRELTEWLKNHQISSGYAPYWTSYHVSFLSQESVKLQSSEYVRIPNYFQAVPGKLHADITQLGAPAHCANPTRVADWNVCLKP